MLARTTGYAELPSKTAVQKSIRTTVNTRLCSQGEQPDPAGCRTQRIQECVNGQFTEETDRMALQINTNVTALTALRNLNNVANSVAGSIEKLSSGLRINTAADDPAGLIISNSLQAQITGLNQAI